jgi:hypothetical protein
MFSTGSAITGPLSPRYMFECIHRAAALMVGLFLASHSLLQADVRISPLVVERNGIQRIEYHSGDKLVAGSADTAPAGVEIKLPGADRKPVSFHAKTERNGVIRTGAGENRRAHFALESSNT